MTVELIGIVTLALGLFSLYRPASFIVQLFLLSTLLGSSAAFILEAVGGTNISPAHLLLGFLADRSQSAERIDGAAAKSVPAGRPGVWLLLSVIYSAISAYFMPRLFAGQAFT